MSAISHEIHQPSLNKITLEIIYLENFIIYLNFIVA